MHAAILPIHFHSHTCISSLRFICLFDLFSSPKALELVNTLMLEVRGYIHTGSGSWKWRLSGLSVISSQST